MNESGPSGGVTKNCGATQKAKSSSRFITWLCAGLTCFFLLIMGGLAPILEPVLHFLIGWGFSIARMVERFESSLILVRWLLAFVGLTVGVHFLATSLCKTKPRWRVTFASIGLLWIALIAGMCLGGSIHQISWLVTSPDPLIGGRSERALHEIHRRNAEYVAQNLLSESTDAADWQKRWRGCKLDLGTHVRYPFQTFAIHLTSGANGKVDEVIFWPRNTKNFQEHGGVVIKRGAEPERADFEETTALLGQRRSARHE